MLDAAVVPAIDSDVLPVVGAGYRVGDVDTFFGLVGLTGRLGAGYRWYGRLLLNGSSFFQIHFSVAIG